MLPLVAVQIGAPGLRQSHPGTTCGRLGLAAKVVGLSLSGPALAAPAQALARVYFLLTVSIRLHIRISKLEPLRCEISDQYAAVKCEADSHSKQD